MTIRLKMNLGLLSIIVPVLLLSLFAILSLERRLRDLGEFHTPALSSIYTIESDVGNAVQESFAYMISGDVREKEEFLLWETAVAGQLETFRRIADLDAPGEEAEKALFDRIASGIGLLARTAKDMFDAYEAEGSLSREAFIRYEAAIDQTREVTQELIEMEKREVEEAKASAIAAISNAERTIISVIIFGLVLTIVSSFFMARSISDPITKLKAVAGAIAQGDLDKTIEIPSKDELGDLSYSFMLMVQQLKKARINLIRQTRLATLGQLSASVAHELRNPLSVIGNAAFFLHRRVPEDRPKWRQYLKIIEQEISRSNQIITNLMALSREDPPEREPVALRALVEEVFERVRGAHAFELVCRVEEEGFSVYADASQLRQVLMNLMTNAVQAMGDEGVIEVEAVRAEGYDEIVVRDEGPGIEREKWEAVFEPLYTTKAQGTGLGLSISRQVVERHGGKLEVVERAGPGAAFRICLPQCETALLRRA